MKIECPTLPHRWLLWLQLWLFVGLSACGFDPLCYDHTSGSELKLSFSTSGAVSGTLDSHSDSIDCDAITPEGLRLQIYDDEDDELMSTYNVTTTSSDVTLPNGDYYLIIYNNDTEYIIYDSLSYYTGAQASTREVEASYQGLSDLMDNTMNQPDMLYANCIHVQENELSTFDSLDVTLHPMVFNYRFRCEFSHGYDHVVSAKGVLSGMAEGVYLSTGLTSATTCTLIFDCTVGEDAITVVVRSFGLPNYSKSFYTTRALPDALYSFGLEVTLDNGNTVDYEFDLSREISGLPYGGSVTMTGLEVDDEVSAPTGSGFTATVSDWSGTTTIDVPLGN